MGEAPLSKLVQVVGDLRVVEAPLVAMDHLVVAMDPLVVVALLAV